MQHFYEVFAVQNIRMAQTGSQLAHLRLLNSCRMQYSIILKYFAHRAVSYDMTVRHYHHALKIACYKFHVVCDDDNTFALAAKGIHNMHKAVHTVCVLPGSGLVQNLSLIHI